MDKAFERALHALVQKKYPQVYTQSMRRGNGVVVSLHKAPKWEEWQAMEQPSIPDRVDRLLELMSCETAFGCKEVQGGIVEPDVMYRKDWLEDNRRRRQQILLDTQPASSGIFNLSGLGFTQRMPHRHDLIPGAKASFGWLSKEPPKEAAAATASASASASSSVEPTARDPSAEGNLRSVDPCALFPGLCSEAQVAGCAGDVLDVCEVSADCSSCRKAETAGTDPEQPCEPERPCELEDPNGGPASEGNDHDSRVASRQVTDAAASQSPRLPSPDRSLWRQDDEVFGVHVFSAEGSRKLF